MWLEVLSLEWDLWLEVLSLEWDLWLDVLSLEWDLWLEELSLEWGLLLEVLSLEWGLTGSCVLGFSLTGDRGSVLTLVLLELLGIPSTGSRLIDTASENKVALKSGVEGFNFFFFLIEGEGKGLERTGDEAGEVSGEPLGVKGDPQIPEED